MHGNVWVGRGVWAPLGFVVHFLQGVCGAPDETYFSTAIDKRMFATSLSHSSLKLAFICFLVYLYASAMSIPETWRKISLFDEVSDSTCLEISGCLRVGFATRFGFITMSMFTRLVCYGYVDPVGMMSINSGWQSRRDFFVLVVPVRTFLLVSFVCRTS